MLQHSRVLGALLYGVAVDCVEDCVQRVITVVSVLLVVPANYFFTFAPVEVGCYLGTQRPAPAHSGHLTRRIRVENAALVTTIDMHGLLWQSKIP